MNHYDDYEHSDNIVCRGGWTVIALCSGVGLLVIVSSVVRIVFDWVRWL